MQLPSTTTTLLLTAATAGLAASAPLSMSLAADEWTMINMTRTCDAADTTCLWRFAIDASASYPPENVAFPKPCNHTVNATVAYLDDGTNVTTPASRATSLHSKCGFFNVTSSWDAGVGEDEGFTTLSVIDYPKGWLTYPAYKDTQVRDGQVVKPDQSYPVQQLP